MVCLPLFPLLGCYEEESCSARFGVTGSVILQHVWPSANCMFNSFELSDANPQLTLELDEDQLLISFRQSDIGVGTHLVDVTYRHELEVWTNSGTLGAEIPCTVRLDEAELENWVVNDHWRLSGILECPGQLESSNGSVQLHDVHFSVFIGQFDHL